MALWPSHLYLFAVIITWWFDEIFLKLKSNRILFNYTLNLTLQCWSSILFTLNIVVFYKARTLESESPKIPGSLNFVRERSQKSPKIRALWILYGKDPKRVQRSGIFKNFNGKDPKRVQRFGIFEILNFFLKSNIDEFWRKSNY